MLFLAMKRLSGLVQPTVNWKVLETFFKAWMMFESKISFRLSACFHLSFYQHEKA